MGRSSADDAERNDGDNDEDAGKISEYDWYGEYEAVGDALRYPEN